MAFSASSAVAAHLPTPQDSSNSEHSLNSPCGSPAVKSIEGPFQSANSLLGLHAGAIPKSKLGSDTIRTEPNVSWETYIPLGSITFPLDIYDTEQWVELDSEALPSILLEHPVYRGFPRLFVASWIRLFLRRNRTSTSHATLRIFLLPDDVARSVVPRDDPKARASLRGLMVNIDRSPEGWEGNGLPDATFPTYVPACGEDDSLFYIFNTLESPQPNADGIADQFASDAVRAILFDSLKDQGLKTDLYPYQRRSAAAMIRRESAPASALDPRLETLAGPTGRTFYFDRDAGKVVADKRTFDEARGGILAETMGYGKTLICLAAILATKATLPEVPPEHSTHTRSHSTGLGCHSLAEMAAGAIARHGIPWKNVFNRLQKEGEFHDRSIEVLESTISTYEIHNVINNRRLSTIVVETIRLASTTLVVVPPNLLSQWRRETERHLETDALSVLVAEDRQINLPDAASLSRYDMILMSRTRFEEETRGRMSWDAPSRGEGSTACRCHITPRLCPEHEYRSSLLDVHFLRFIVDEGQGFVSSASKTHALAGLQSIKVDRKWIVSGTPTSGLIGVEVDLAAEEHSDSTRSSPSRTNGDEILGSGSPLCASSNNSVPTPVQTTLVKRRKTPAFDQERKDIERLGHIVKYFLGLRPWANGPTDRDAASWSVHVVPSSSGTRKPLSLRSVLSSLVVRHRIEDIERDLQLPPLFNRTVKLQPSFFDKLSVDLFILSLAANAVTSERQDQDYMFHPRNRKNLEALVKNMRSSAFFWSGFTNHDIYETCRVSREYLEKHEDSVSWHDRQLLSKAVSAGQAALDSPAWNAFSTTSEIGVYVSKSPPNLSSWALCPNKDNILLGATQLEAAKQLVEKNIYASDPLKPLASGPPNRAGAETATAKNLKQDSPKKSNSQNEDSHSGKGIPKSSIKDSPKLTSGQFSMHSTNRRKPSIYGTMKGQKSKQEIPSEARAAGSILKAESRTRPPLPQSYAALEAMKLVGTASVKLSYLLDRIAELHADEKILVFYEADHIAYYCAQALEVLGIPHFIYASGITLKLRTEYLDMFNSDNIHRVMLMDIKQAAHGLHVASASRVFFINPVWQPNIEAQAIKRAHRIGQVRPVYVETLVLEGTIEEQMLQRRKNMTTQEQQKASKSLLDDTTMADMIKAMHIIPLTETERLDEGSQFAPLKRPQQILARAIASQYAREELDAFIIANPAAEDNEQTSPKAGHSLKMALRTDTAKRDEDAPAPKKKRRIIFADESHKPTPNPEAGIGGDMAASSSNSQGPQATRPPQMRRSAQSRSDPVDAPIAWGNGPPLDALQPRRTIRFAEDTAMDD
ncbi:MAG: hypothetical protein MMC23_007666 [Stictis urceolatum]|nr:hypothetical protein [Stictis urceolata]